MNWNSPVADELRAVTFGSKFDSTLAVASRYSKLAPLACAARWIAPATGALAFYCSIHIESGMQGAFSVSATTAAASGTPTTVASSSGGYGGY